MGPRPFGRGNRLHREQRGTGAGASMGPRPFGRGNSMTTNTVKVTVLASMGPRPFGRGNVNAPPRSRTHRPGFNGAATVRSRKHHKGQIYRTGPHGLQWGRDRSVAETGTPSIPRSAASRSASMGPRPFGRGNLDAPGPKHRRGTLQWGRDRSVAETRQNALARCALRQASMGPRPFGRGNSLKIVSRRMKFLRLQWGRDRSVAETIWPSRSPGDQSPLQWGRDRSVAETRPWGVEEWWCAGASMGPRPFGRGNGAADQRP